MARGCLTGLVGTMLFVGGAAGGTLGAADRSAICGARQSCDVTLHEAGQSSDRIALTVAEARFGPAERAAEAPDSGCLTDAGQRYGGTEIWRLKDGTPPLRVLTLCNWLDNPPGVDQDAIRVADNRIVRVYRYGNLAETETFELDPWRHLHQRLCESKPGTPYSGDIVDFDFATFVAKSVVFDRTPHPKWAMGCPTWPERFAIRPARGLLGGYAIVLPNGDARLPKGAALGSCGLRLSTDGKSGFLLRGRPSEKDRAELRAIFDGAASLVLQIDDATAASVAQGASWKDRPRVELWTGGGSSNPDFGTRIRRDPPSIDQIAITLDGVPHPGLGDPILPDVERWEAEGPGHRPVTVLRLRWAKGNPKDGWFLMYVQREGRGTARAVASAGVAHRRPLYLPSAADEPIACRLEAGLWNIAEAKPPSP
jgi:hypothetical protein